MNYPTHRRRLMPLLANSYALDFTLKHLVRRKLAAEGWNRARDKAAGSPRSNYSPPG